MSPLVTFKTGSLLHGLNSTAMWLASQVEKLDFMLRDWLCFFNSIMEGVKENQAFTEKPV